MHDEILQPFLDNLKKHLEDIQVCLGKIEEWLREPEYTKNFIEATFNKQLDIPQKESDYLIDCPHPRPDQICRKCNCTYDSHYHYICPYARKKVNGDFREPREFVLKQMQFGGKLEYSFVVDCEQGQERLKKILEFVESL